MSKTKVTFKKESTSIRINEVGKDGRYHKIKIMSAKIKKKRYGITSMDMNNAIQRAKLAYDMDTGKMYLGFTAIRGSKSSKVQYLIKFTENIGTCTLASFVFEMLEYKLLTAEISICSSKDTIKQFIDECLTIVNKAIIEQDKLGKCFTIVESYRSKEPDETEIWNRLFNINTPDIKKRDTLIPRE